LLFFIFYFYLGEVKLGILDFIYSFLDFIFGGQVWRYNISNVWFHFDLTYFLSTHLVVIIIFDPSTKLSRHPCALVTVNTARNLFTYGLYGVTSSPL